MTVSEAFPGNFLEAADLPHGKSITVEITNVANPGTEKAADKRVIPRPILTFKGKKKRLILNKTNAKRIQQTLGLRDMDKWVGQQIQLISTTCKFQGDPNYPCIRVPEPKVSEIIK